MKKLIALLLILCLSLSLAACGGKGPDSEPSTAGTGGQQPAAPAAGGQTTGDSEPAGAEPEEPIAVGEFKTDAFIEEAVLYDDEVTVTATSLTYDSYTVYLNLSIVNNTDRALSVYNSYEGYPCCAVNGYMIHDGYIACTVEPQEAAEWPYSINIESLTTYGISEVADILLSLCIEDEDYNQTYTGILGVLTSAFDSYNYLRDTHAAVVATPEAEEYFNYRVLHFDEETSYEEKGLRQLSSCVIVNSWNEPVLMVELENISGSTVVLRTRDISVDGLGTYDSVWDSNVILNNTRFVTYINLGYVYGMDFEGVDVDGIGTATLSFGQWDLEGNKLSDYKKVKVM